MMCQEMTGDKWFEIQIEECFICNVSLMVTLPTIHLHSSLTQTLTKHLWLSGMNSNVLNEGIYLRKQRNIPFPPLSFAISNNDNPLLASVSVIKLHLSYKPKIHWVKLNRFALTTMKMCGCGNIQYKKKNNCHWLCYI